MKVEDIHQLCHGQIISVNFPFEEKNNMRKPRPAYMMSHNDKDKIIALKITTHERRSPYDYEIKNWKKAGLKYPSVVRCDKSEIFEPFQIYKTLGVMPKEEIKIIDTLYQRYCQEKEIQIDDDFDL